MLYFIQADTVFMYQIQSYDLCRKKQVADDFFQTIQFNKVILSYYYSAFDPTSTRDNISS